MCTRIDVCSPFDEQIDNVYLVSINCMSQSGSENACHSAWIGTEIKKLLHELLISFLNGVSERTTVIVFAIFFLIYIRPCIEQKLNDRSMTKINGTRQRA
jgi:hypothetical protein